jgi:hypothetical protein
MISSNIFHPRTKKKLEQVLISFQLSIHHTTSNFQLFNNCVNFQSLFNFFPQFFINFVFFSKNNSSIKVICKVWKRKGEILMFVENTRCSKKHRAKRWQRKTNEAKLGNASILVHFLISPHIFLFCFLCATFDNREDYKIE